MSFDDLPVPFRVELQCEKKTRLRAARSASNPDGISVEDRGVASVQLRTFKISRSGLAQLHPFRYTEWCRVAPPTSLHEVFRVGMQAGAKTQRSEGKGV